MSMVAESASDICFSCGEIFPFWSDGFSTLDAPRWSSGVTVSNIGYLCLRNADVTVFRIVITFRLKAHMWRAAHKSDQVQEFVSSEPVVWQILNGIAEKTDLLKLLDQEINLEISPWKRWMQQ